MLASIIIPTLNEERFIENCLRALSSQSVLRNLYEIIIVDGGSTDNTLKISKKFADKIIKNVKGIGAARQAGLKAARASIVCFTDADSIVNKDWLEKIFSSLSDGVSCVTGPVIPLEKKVNLKVRFLFISWNLLQRIGIILNTWGAIGSNFASHKKMLLKIGGLQNIPFEDMDISHRLSKLGRIIYNPSIVVKTSIRRYDTWGLIKTCKNVLLSAIPAYFGFEPVTEWKKIDNV